MVSECIIRDVSQIEGGGGCGGVTTTKLHNRGLHSNGSGSTRRHSPGKMGFRNARHDLSGLSWPWSDVPLAPPRIHTLYMHISPLSTNPLLHYRPRYARIGLPPTFTIPKPHVRQDPVPRRNTEEICDMVGTWPRTSPTRNISTALASKLQDKNAPGSRIQSQAGTK